MIWSPVDRILWGIAIAALIMAGIQCIKRGKEYEGFNERITLYGFACLFFGFAVYKFFFCLAEFAMPGTFKNFAFYGDLTNLSKLSNYFFKLCIISYSVGGTMFILSFELTFKRTKYVLSVIGAILIVIFIISPYRTTFFLFQSIGFSYFFFVIYIILIYHTKWAHQDLKTILFLLMFGITLLLIGFALTDNTLMRYMWIPTYIPPVLIILGVLIATSPMYIEPKLFSKGLFVWVIIGMLTLISFFAFFFYMIYSGVPIAYLYNGAILMFILIFIFYKAIIMTKTPKSYITSIEKEVLRPDILSVFTKPQKITEEEVSISKEKKICLVCKNEISRENYICPECKAFYCMKCAQALANLENACWVCDTIFDESKPVRLQEKKEDEIAIEGLDQKKAKKI